MITNIQHSSPCFTAKIPTKKVGNTFAKFKNTSKLTENVKDIVDTTALDNALNDFFSNVRKNPKKIGENLKFAGKVLKESFKVNWNFYFGK